MMETELKELLQQIKEEKAQLIAERNKPSAFRNFWDWAKPYIIPLVFCFASFIGGVIVCELLTVSKAPTPALTPVPVTLEEQAAAGGAAVPFPSGSSSLPPLNSPPENLIEEPSDSSLTTTSEEPSPSSPQADNGEISSNRYYRLPLRRTR